MYLWFMVNDLWNKIRRLFGNPCAHGPHVVIAPAHGFALLAPAFNLLEAIGCIKNQDLAGKSFPTFGDGDFGAFGQQQHLHRDRVRITPPNPGDIVQQDHFLIKKLDKRRVNQ